MSGIEHSKKALEEVRDLLVVAVSVAKSQSVFAALPKLYDAFGAVKGIVSDVPFLLPELKDLDSKEAGELAACAYDVVRALVQVVAPK